MSHLSPAMLQLLSVACRLRASGHTWEKIALEVHRSPETCRHWPERYADDWERLYRRARNRYLLEIGLEASLVQHSLLRSKDERILARCSQFLLGVELRVNRNLETPPDAAATAPSDSHRFADYLETLDEHQVKELVDQLVAIRQRLASQPGSPGDSVGAAAVAE